MTPATVILSIEKDAVKQKKKNIPSWVLFTSILVISLLVSRIIKTEKMQFMLSCSSPLEQHISLQLFYFVLSPFQCQSFSLGICYEEKL